MHSHFLENVESLLCTLAEGVVVTGRDHKIQLMNSPAENLLGCDRRLAVGLDWSDLLTEASLPFIEEETKGLLHHAKGVVSVATPCDVQVKLGDEFVELQMGGTPLYTDGRVMPAGILWHVRSRSNGDGAPSIAPAVEESTHQRVGLFQQAFNRSPVPQCMIESKGLRQLLTDRGIKGEDALKQAVEDDSELVSELRHSLSVPAANMSMATLFAARDDTHLIQRFMQQIDNEFVVQISILFTVVAPSSVTSDFQLELTAFDSSKKLVKVKATLPSQDSVEDGILLSFVDDYEFESDDRGYIDCNFEWFRLLEKIPYYVSVFEVKSWRRLYENAPMGTYLGYSIEEINHSKSDHWYQILHPVERENRSIYKEMYAKMRNGESYETVLRFLHKNGAWHFICFKSTGLEYDDKGRPITAVGIAQDITTEMMAQRKLAGQEQRYRLLATNITDVLWSSDEDFNINYVTPSIEQVLGYTAKEVLACGNEGIFHNEPLKDLEQFLKSQLHALIIKSRRGVPREYIKDYRHTRFVPVNHKSGKLVWLEIQASPLVTEKNTIKGMLCISRDITMRKKNEDELIMAAKVFQNGLAATVITNPDGVAIQINRAYTRITGYTSVEILDNKPLAVLDTEAQAEKYRRILYKVKKTGYWEGEIVLRRKNGEQFPSWMAVTEVTNDDNGVVGYITTFTDITERKISEERIHKLAYFDLLTGLPNRSLFSDRLDQALQHAIRSKEYVALLFLDLDRFKAINDTMGHSVGDQLLRVASRRLLDSVRREDTVARMGGDEFTVILGGLQSRHKAVNAAAHVAHKVMRELSRPFVLEDKETFIGTSIGISFFPVDAEDPAALLQKADTAMYHAKAMGKNNYQFYAEAMTETALARLEIESCLHTALENDEFHIAYQPIVSTNEQQIVGVEALLRWSRQGDRLVSPTEFIPIAEEAGLIVDIGGWVLESACHQVAMWEAQGYLVGRVAVNVSPKQFSQGIIIEQLKKAIRVSGVKPDQIEIEVTEGILMGDQQNTLDTMSQLQKMGVRISIDDFGTGYSSLSYLRQFPIHNLKIDRSFIHGIPGHAQDESLVEAIVAMANALHLNVIAEGVEGAEQFEFVKSLGCGEVQGYFLGRPQSANEVTSYFNTAK